MPKNMSPPRAGPPPPPPLPYRRWVTTLFSWDGWAIDTAGHSLLATLSGTGVDTSHVRLLPGHCSQVSSVVIDHFGERQIINFSSPRLAPDPSWLPADIIASADFLLVDVRWPEGAKKALEIAAAGNVASLIDADLAPVDTSPLIGLASYAVFSERVEPLYRYVRDW